jgi:hypothetical protein
MSSRPFVDEGGHVRHRVDHALDTRSDPLRRRGAAWNPSLVAGAHEVEEVRALRLVELKRPAYGIEHLVGHAARVAAFEPGVVLDADACDQRDLLAAQP